MAELLSSNLFSCTGPLPKYKEHEFFDATPKPASNTHQNPSPFKYGKAKNRGIATSPCYPATAGTLDLSGAFV